MSRSRPVVLLLGLAVGCGTPAGLAPEPSSTSGEQPSSTSAVEAPSAEAPPASAAPSEAPSASAPQASAAASAEPPVAGPCPAGMVFVAGGTFDRHKPGDRKKPTVRDFCLDRAEVTVAAYKECVKEKKCSPRCLEIGRCTAVPVDADWPDKMETIRASMFCNGSRDDRDDHPVNCVSFDEAKGYCEARDRRLPTGDEWEWAVVGDRPAPVFPWGRTAPAGEDLCWGHPYRRSLTCLPGSFPRDTSRDGVVDMAGNLSEWVVHGTPEKPRRQLRGASWYAVDDGYVQMSLWGFQSTSSRSEVFGFRCARDPQRP